MMKISAVSLLLLLLSPVCLRAAVAGQHFVSADVPAFVGRADVAVGTLVVTADADEAEGTVVLSLKAPGAVLPKTVRLGTAEGTLADGKAAFRVPLKQGENRFEVFPDPGRPKSLTDSLSIEGHRIRIGSLVACPNQRIADRNRTSGNFRIPGIAATNTGALVAVFDIRYTGRHDLPRDICVGASVSHDRGLTWSPIVTAIDYKGLPGGKGVGDPCILVDPATNRVWVMAVNATGDGKKPIRAPSGTLDPKHCGPLVLAYSDDEGKTWSKPIQVTAEAKRLGDPDTAAWGGVLQGPGQGIAMRDGTLVFPMQAWGKGGGFLMTSKDHGKTWHGSKAMPRSGSESTVAEIEPGVLLLNTRGGAPHGEYRPSGITRDLGETWEPYPAEKLCHVQCQASLLKVGDSLLFSHPDSTTARERMTLHVSDDKGKTWPRCLLYDRRVGAGYSSVCPVGKDAIGVLYEGDADYLYFLCIPLNDVGIASPSPLAADWQDFRVATPMAGSGLTLECNGATVSAEGKQLRTNGKAPVIRLPAVRNVGYNGGRPLTVVLRLPSLPQSEAPLPLVHIGNGSSGIGLALQTLNAATGRARLSGTWGRGLYAKSPVSEFTFPSGGEPLYVAFRTSGPGNGDAQAALLLPGAKTLNWVTFGGLRGGCIWADRIALGNCPGADAAGLDCTLEQVTVVEGCVSDDVLRSLLPFADAAPTAATADYTALNWTRADGSPAPAPGPDALATLTLKPGTTLRIDAVPAAGRLKLVCAGDVRVECMPAADVGSWPCVFDGSGIKGTLTLTRTALNTVMRSAAALPAVCVDTGADAQAPCTLAVSVALPKLSVRGAAPLELAAETVLTETDVRASLTDVPLTGAGTFRFHFPSDWPRAGTGELPRFNGTAELLSGKCSLKGECHIGRCLRVVDGGLQTAATAFLTSDLEIVGAPVELHCNGGRPLTLKGNLLGTGTLERRGTAELILKGAASEMAVLAPTTGPDIIVDDGARLTVHAVKNPVGHAATAASLRVKRGGTLRVDGEAHYDAVAPLVVEAGARLERTATPGAGLSVAGGGLRIEGRCWVVPPSGMEGGPLVSVLTTDRLQPQTMQIDAAAAQAGWALFRGDGRTLYCVNARHSALPEASAGNYEPAAAGALLQRAPRAQRFAVVRHGQVAPLTAALLNGAYACFDTLDVAVSPDGSEAALTIGFDVTQMRPVSVEGRDCLVVEVSTGAALKPQVTLGLEGMAGVEEVTDAGGTIVGRSPEARRRYLRLPMVPTVGPRLFRAAAMAPEAMLAEGSVVQPPADGTPLCARRSGGVALAAWVLITPQSSLTLSVDGPGTYAGQGYALTDAAGTPLARAVRENTGNLTFAPLPPATTFPAGTTLHLVADTAAGAVTLRTHSWDVSSMMVGQTVPVQAMIAEHPQMDFAALPWAENISDNATYRIPGLAADGQGGVVAVYDIRWKSSKDLDAKTSPIDMGESYSADGGHRWEAPRIAVDVPNVSDPNPNAPTAAKAADRDFGDPCVVYSPKDKAYFAMGITGGGLAAYGGANNPNNGLALYRRAAGTADAPWKPVYPDNETLEKLFYDAMFAAGAGNEWIKANVHSGAEFRKASRGILQGPGHGMVTTVAHGAPGTEDFIPAGTVVFPMQWFFNTTVNTQTDRWFYHSYAFAVYTSDGGKSWRSTRFAPDMSSQENCIAELDDGSWHMIAKCAKAGQRYHYRSTDGLTWERTPYKVTKPSQCVQGSLLKIGRDRQGRSRYAMAYSRTKDRGELMLCFGTDATHDPRTAPNGILWDDPSTALMIHRASTGGRSYNSLCLPDDGIIGILYEANTHIYFVRVDIRDRLSH